MHPEKIGFPSCSASAHDNLIITMIASAAHINCHTITPGGRRDRFSDDFLMVSDDSENHSLIIWARATAF
jgi:hypothetical protein